MELSRAVRFERGWKLNPLGLRDVAYDRTNTFLNTFAVVSSCYSATGSRQLIMRSALLEGLRSFADVVTVLVVS